MKIYRGLDNIPHFCKAVATMGSFDGLHGGHQELLRRVSKIAAEKGGTSIVITFEPHPRHVLGTGDDLYLLSTLDEKLYLLEMAGIENVIIIPFTKEFSRTSPEDFIKNSIIAIGIETLVVGYNHRFGHNKQGDYDFLESNGEKLEIHMVEQQQMQQSKVSSTIIRQTIEQGDMIQAAKLLAHPYILIGRVDYNGNISDLENVKLLPPAGRYSIRIDHSIDAELEIGPKRDIKIKGWNKYDQSECKVLVEINDIINR